MWFIHKWKYVGRQLNHYGMGLESFDVYTCEKCNVYADKIIDRNSQTKLLIDGTQPQWLIPCVGKKLVNLIRKKLHTT